MMDCEDRQTIPDDPNDRLMHAVRTGDLETTTKLLNSHGIPNWSTGWSEGYNLLCQALEHDHEDIAKLLLIRGAEVNNSNNSKQLTKTPLHLAVSNGNIEIVDMLLKRESNVDAQDDLEDTPIHTAIKNCNYKIVEKLLNGGTNLQVKSRGMTPLHTAANLGSNMIIEALLDRNANIDSICTGWWEYGYTPLHFAVACGNAKTVMLLLTKGAKVNVKSKNGLTPLHLAIKMDYYKVAKSLLEHGADVDSHDINGRSILYSAVKRCEFKLVELVLEHSPDRKSKENGQSLYAAVNKNYDSRIVEALVHYGFTINGDVIENRNLLHAAVRQGYIGIVNDFLESKENVDIEQKDEKGVTLLHEAAKQKNVDIVNLLIRNNANINAEDENGKTPIHYAVQNLDNIIGVSTTSTKNIIEMLLEKGACINAATKSGETPLHAVTSMGKSRMVNFLLDHGANVNATDKKNITPLHLCAMNSEVKIMKILLAKGATVNATSTAGNSPLHLAVKRNYDKCVKLLINHGADIGYRNKEGQNSLHIAAESSAENVIDVLLDYFDGIDNRDNSGRTALHIASRKFHGDMTITRTLLNHNANVNLVCDDGYTPFDYVGRDTEEYAFDDDTSYDEDPFQLLTMFEHHFVKLITLRRYVSERNLEVIDIYEEYRDTYEECKKEVDLMRGTKIGDSNVNFYDLLTKDMNQLAINMRNKIIVDTLGKDDHKKKFINYGGMLDSRFKKCLKRERLLDPSMKSLSSLIGCNLDWSSIAELVSYLSNADLENLIKADQMKSGDNRERLL